MGSTTSLIDLGSVARDRTNGLKPTGYSQRRPKLSGLGRMK